MERGFRRQDGPAHLREAPRKKRRGGFNDVVLGFKPRHMQRPAGRVGPKRFVLHRGEAHKGFHLVHVAAYGLGQMLSAHAVGVQRVVPQTRLMHQPPEQAVEQAETIRVAVQDHALAQRQKFGRHVDGRCVAVRLHWHRPL